MTFLSLCSTELKSGGSPSTAQCGGEAFSLPAATNHQQAYMVMAEARLDTNVVRPAFFEAM